MAGPDIKNFEALPVTVSSDDTSAPDADTRSLDALLASLNTSAERFQTLWFSFLGLTLYFAIAALTTTHKDLLLGEPKTLPLLNIPVPLLPFYFIAPLLYLVFHFYLLMMLALLARTAAEFEKQLQTALPNELDREGYRAQVENALFLQLLVGMRSERAGFNGFLLGVISLITIVIAPLATLVLMQMMFLPYHHLSINWWHCVFVGADLVLILVTTYQCFLPREVMKASLVLDALRRRPRWARAMALCVVLAVLLTAWVSFVVGRWAGEPYPSSLKEWALWMLGHPAEFQPVLSNNAATVKGVILGRYFPDRLLLRAEPVVVGKDKLEKTKEEMASRGGDFVRTIDLDFRDLQAADMSGADLRGVSLSATAMPGANLHLVRLDGARLFNTQLQGATLSGAQLQGALLNGAQLQGADLAAAGLRGASLSIGETPFLKLNGARLQGANLSGAQLQGANLSYAELQGANLSGAQLQGANLFNTQLQGADLTAAQLQGADLTGAQLQGADLSQGQLQDAQLNGTFVWRTNVAAADLSTVSIGSVQIKPLSQSDINGWVADATRFASTETRGKIDQRFARLKPDFQAADQDGSDRQRWKSLEDLDQARDPRSANHRQRLVILLGDLACGAVAAPYIARQLIGTGLPDLVTPSRLPDLGDQLERVRKRMKDGREKPESCPGVAGFTEEDWRALEALRPN
jgi:uncharacterized protein YjbI with pentapeptide repeats